MILFLLVLKALNLFYGTGLQFFPNLFTLIFCIREIPKQVFFAKSEDPDEMQHHAAFHQGLHCL